MKFRPLADRVLVRRKVSDAMTAGGILIPETVQEKPQEGEVLAVGPGRYENGALVPVSVKVGDTVVFGKWVGTDIKVEGEQLMIMEESQIIGVVAA
jgi:chaperonin GroES